MHGGAPNLGLGRPCLSHGVQIVAVIVLLVLPHPDCQYRGLGGEVVGQVQIAILAPFGPVSLCLGQGGRTALIVATLEAAYQPLEE